MPQRSNSFQRLIRSIETRLNAPARVRESFLLRDRNGQERELDVVVEGEIGARSLLISIECRDRRRKASVEWIDELIGKYADLTAVNQIVAVSSSGFSSRALKKAASHDIETLTLEQATRADWNDTLRRIGAVSVRLQLYRLANMTLALGTEPETGELPSNLHDAMIAPAGREPIHLGTAIKSLLAHPAIQGKIDDAIGAGTEEIATTRMQLHGWSVVTPSRHLPMEYVEITVERRTEAASVDLTQADYAGAAVAFGEGEIGPFDIRVVGAAVSARAGGQLSIELAAKQNRGNR